MRPTPAPAISISDSDLGLLVALIAVGGVVVGGLVAGLFALLTGWLQHKREREAWVIERQFTAYIDFLAAMDRLAFERQDVDALIREATVRLVGPDKLSVQANRLIITARDLSRAKGNSIAPAVKVYQRERAVFASLARSVVGIPDESRSPRLRGVTVDAPVPAG